MVIAIEIETDLMTFSDDFHFLGLSKGSCAINGLCVFWAFLISSSSGPGDRVGEVGSYVPHRLTTVSRLFSCALAVLVPVMIK